MVMTPGLQPGGRADRPMTVKDELRQAADEIENTLLRLRHAMIRAGAAEPEKEVPNNATPSEETLFSVLSRIKSLSANLQGVATEVESIV